MQSNTSKYFCKYSCKYSGALILAVSTAVIGLSAPAALAADIKIGAPLALTGPLAD